MKKFQYLLIVSFVLLIAGCSKDKDENTTTTPSQNSSGITINSTAQYSIKVDGNSFARMDGSQNFQGVVSWSASITTPPDSSSTSFGSGLADNNSPNLGFSIDIGNITFSGNSVDPAAFKAFIQAGSYSYTPSGNNKVVAVRWADENGNFYSTEWGTGTQTGSTFTITDVQDAGTVLGHAHVKFKATFNCTLYDFFGSAKTLTDGVYVGYFENYN